MRLIRSFLLCAGLVLAAGCGSDDILPPVDDLQTWVAHLESGTGAAATSQTNYLALEDDGHFVWDRAHHGDGVSRPDKPMGASFQTGSYRIRDGYLDLHTRVVGSVTAEGVATQTQVAAPVWSGDVYRIVTMDGDRLTLRFVPPESSSRTEITLDFVRIRPID